MRALTRTVRLALAASAVVAGSIAVAGPANAASTPLGACGSGYHEIDHQDVKLSGTELGVIHLMYNGSIDCVVTWKTAYIGKETGVSSPLSRLPKAKTATKALISAITSTTPDLSSSALPESASSGVGPLVAKKAVHPTVGILQRVARGHTVAECRVRFTRVAAEGMAAVARVKSGATRAGAPARAVRAAEESR